VSLQCPPASERATAETANIAIALNARTTVRGAIMCHCALTVKLRGRTTTLDKRRGRMLSSSARGAKQTTPHGPLQRLLGATAAALPVIRKQPLLALCQGCPQLFGIGTLRSRV